MSALWSMGPRQTTAASSATKKPIDMTFTPCDLERAWILRSPEIGGLSAPRPNMRGME